MKNVFNFNNLLAMFIIAVSFTACTKDKEDDIPAPDVATQVSGKYVFSELEFDGQTVPADKSNLKGDIKITKNTETTIDAVLNIRSKTDNSEFMVYDVTGISLVESAGNIDLIYDGERVAQIKGKKIIVNGTDDVGVDFTITATR